ncbi:MAG: hypothetical protein ABSG41_13750 [Bryobacteraceae bacterium]
MNDIPQEFGDRIDSIRAGLLRIHSRWLEDQDLNKALRDSYDVFASALVSAGATLTESRLTEFIPGCVFQWAVAKKWMIERPQRFAKDRKRPPGQRYYSPYEPVPDSELTVQLGPYKVIESYKADLVGRVSSRVAYWQAEALTLAERSVSAQPGVGNGFTGSSVLGEDHEENPSAQKVEAPLREAEPVAIRGDRTDRRLAVNAYIEEVFCERQRTISRTDLWRHARYKSRAEFERWESYWYERHGKPPNKSANAKFSRMLKEKPHLK